MVNDLFANSGRVDYVIRYADVTVDGVSLTVEAGTVIGQQINATSGNRFNFRRCQTQRLVQTIRLCSEEYEGI